MPQKKNPKQPNNNNNKKNMTDLLYFRKICSLESLKNIDIWFLDNTSFPSMRSKYKLTLSIHCNIES